jgi:nitronate monooxygenase
MPDRLKMTHPQIIQGGMGAGVSGWALARAVSQRGQLGVVSGTAIETIFARRLQLGDPDGTLRLACEHFPFPEVAERALSRYFLPDGKQKTAPFKPVPVFSFEPARSLVELTVLANFVEVFLAKEGHHGLVGINLLEKIQLPTLPSLFGAMLAGVDYVLMGAGIPRAIPGILDQLALGKRVQLRLDVADADPGREFISVFDPADFCGQSPPVLRRPQFLAIISSATLALTLARKSTGQVDGFIVEGSSAGGHNAPPRGGIRIDERGEPIYGDRDTADLEKIRAIGLPFWLAGSYGRPGRLAEALALGAAGIQVGTPFAFCEESGIDPRWKERVLAACRSGEIRIFTDPKASPTGFPFKVVLGASDTASDSSPEVERSRICDLGYLRQSYQKPEGTLGFRCPGEPVKSYLEKGGSMDDIAGRRCVCNGLLATIGLGQMRAGIEEEPLLTAGDDLVRIAEFLPPNGDHYRASDVIDRLL